MNVLQVLTERLAHVLLRTDESEEKTIANKEIIKNAELATIKNLVIIMDSDDTDMEEFIKNCKMEWTILRPVEFMKKVFFQWAEPIKTHNSVFTAFPDTSFC